MRHTLPLATAYPKENQKTNRTVSACAAPPKKNAKAPVQGGCTGAHVATGLKPHQEGEHGSGQVTLTTAESGKSHVEKQRRMLRPILIWRDGNDLLSARLFKCRLRKNNRG